MELNDYQEAALGTALESAQNIEYVAALLASEAGEFNGHWSKAIRDDGFISEERGLLMIKELGDILWGVAVAADLLGVTMDECAQINLDKLASRKNRGVIGGSGDNR